MSRTIILAGLIAAAAAIAPKTTYAQRVNGAAALLAPVGQGFPLAAPLPDRIHTDPIDGERALLGRSITRPSEVVSQPTVGVAPAATSIPTDGAYALLGRRR